MTGTGLSQAITIGGTLILARLFAPEAFGLLALYITLVSFLGVLGGGRYELAIMLPETDADAANILTLSLLVGFGISLICLLLVALFRFPIASLLGDARIADWLWSIPPVVLVFDTYNSLYIWCSRLKQFRRLAYSRVFLGLGTVLAQLGLFFMHVSPGLALIGGWIFGQFLALLILAAQVLANDARFLIAAHNPASIRSSIAEYKNFPLYKAPYSFVTSAASQLVFVVLRIFASLEIVGLYSLANRAIYLPISLIASSMNQVFYEKAATELRQGRLEDFVTRALRVQVVLATPFLVFVVFESKFLFGKVLGSQWAQGGSYVVSLAFAGFLYFLTSWLDRIFDVCGRQRLSLILGFLGNGISLAALAVVLKLTANPVFAVAMFSACEVLYGIVWLAAAFHIANFSLKSLWHIAQDVLISGLSLAVLFALVNTALHPWPWLALSVVVLLLSIWLLFSFVRYVRGGYAFTSTADRFRRFWADKSTCLNHSESADFYAAQGRELRQLLAKPEYKSVLEIGCGEGSLFPHLHFDKDIYRGVDFSSHFLETFRSRHPGVQLECAEGASYCRENQQFDLILSNGVVQHFDPQMFSQHIANARRMMHSNSELICGCILDKNRRRLYDSGIYNGANGGRWKILLKSTVRRLLGLDAMGYWYDQKEIATLARQHGLAVRFIPSAIYPYRFHAVLTVASDPSLRNAPSSANARAADPALSHAR
jgi:lipopolysaccharide exporter